MGPYIIRIFRLWTKKNYKIFIIKLTVNIMFKNIDNRENCLPVLIGNSSITLS